MSTHGGSVFRLLRIRYSVPEISWPERESASATAIYGLSFSLLAFDHGGIAAVFAAMRFVARAVVAYEAMARHFPRYADVVSQNGAGIVF